jgi:8-oxo-dGTP diphosphatase
MAAFLRVASGIGDHRVSDLPRHSVSTTAIVFRDDGRVLAIQRSDDGRWVPPGGVLELAETPADGVAREVLEETGIRVQAERLTGVYKNMNLGVVSLTFKCRMVGGQTHPTDEARQVAWLTVDEAKRAMVEARAIRVTDALCDNGPFVRSHDGTHLL